MSDRKVQGYCPMGCGETLMLAQGGYVTCGLLPPGGCPNPTAVADLLGDRRTDHLVYIDSNSWNVLHPLHERLNDAVLSCPLGEYLASLGGPPVKPGAYRAVFESSGWQFSEAVDV